MKIGSIIYYPIHQHMAECYKYLGYRRGSYPITEKYAEEILSLPTYYGMNDDEVEHVIEVCNGYKKR